MMMRLMAAPLSSMEALSLRELIAKILAFKS